MAPSCQPTLVHNRRSQVHVDPDQCVCLDPDQVWPENKGFVFTTHATPVVGEIFI